MLKIQYLALLRGINVGGKNIIKMADLKACFEKMEFADVVTFIQSGNVLFKSNEKDKINLTHQIESTLSKRFNYHSRIVVISKNQLKKVVETAPKGFGKEPEKYRYDVIFLKKPLTSNEAMNSVTTKEGVDKVHLGKGVLYFSRLISKASQSRLSKIITLPVYQNMTIRNWNTTSRLLELIGERMGEGEKEGK